MNKIFHTFMPANSLHRIFIKADKAEGRGIYRQQIHFLFYTMAIDIFSQSEFSISKIIFLAV